MSGRIALRLTGTDIEGRVISPPPPMEHKIVGTLAGDKITGQIITFEIGIDETKRFGALNVRPRICNTRPVTEEPKTTAFVEVDENLLNGKLKRIFNGWMLAESPGLNAVEHPIYDVWLKGCRDPNRKPEPEPEPEPQAPPADEPAPAD